METRGKEQGDVWKQRKGVMGKEVKRSSVSSSFTWRWWSREKNQNGGAAVKKSEQVIKEEGEGSIKQEDGRCSKVEKVGGRRGGEAGERTRVKCGRNWRRGHNWRGGGEWSENMKGRKLEWGKKKGGSKRRKGKGERGGENERKGFGRRWSGRNKNKWRQVGLKKGEEE